MLSHLAGVGEPYPLPSGLMYFHDWRWTQPGRSLADCDPISGNEFDRVVTWRGASGLDLPEGAPVSLRLTLRASELFTISFSKE